MWSGMILDSAVCVQSNYIATAASMLMAAKDLGTNSSPKFNDLQLIYQVAQNDFFSDRANFAAAASNSIKRRSNWRSCSVLSAAFKNA